MSVIAYVMLMFAAFVLWGGLMFSTAHLLGYNRGMIDGVRNLREDEEL